MFMVSWWQTIQILNLLYKDIHVGPMYNLRTVLLLRFKSYASLNKSVVWLNDNRFQYVSTLDSNQGGLDDESTPYFSAI